jgi:hypothetical protein
LSSIREHSRLSPSLFGIVLILRTLRAYSTAQSMPAEAGIHAGTPSLVVRAAVRLVE